MHKRVFRVMVCVVSLIGVYFLFNFNSVYAKDVVYINVKPLCDFNARNSIGSIIRLGFEPNTSVAFLPDDPDSLSSFCYKLHEQNSYFEWDVNSAPPNLLFEYNLKSGGVFKQDVLGHIRRDYTHHPDGIYLSDYDFVLNENSDTMSYSAGTVNIISPVSGENFPKNNNIVIDAEIDGISCLDKENKINVYLVHLGEQRNLLFSTTKSGDEIKVSSHLDLSSDPYRDWCPDDESCYDNQFSILIESSCDGRFLTGKEHNFYVQSFSTVVAGGGLENTKFGFYKYGSNLDTANVTFNVRKKAGFWNYAVPGSLESCNVKVSSCGRKYIWEGVPGEGEYILHADALVNAVPYEAEKEIKIKKGDKKIFIVMFGNDSKLRIYDASSVVGVNNSNKGIEACSGDMGCVNCVARYKSSDGSIITFSQAEKKGEISNADFQGVAEVALTTPDSLVYTNNIYTALGCIETSYQGTITRVLQMGLGISGGLILFRIGAALIKIMGAQDPSEAKEGAEMIWSAILALLLLLFGAMGLNFLGVNVLRIMPSNTVQT